MSNFNTEEYLLTRIKTFQPPLYVKVEPNLAGDGSHSLVVHRENDKMNSVTIATHMPLYESDEEDPEKYNEERDAKHKELADRRFDEAIRALGFDLGDKKVGDPEEKDPEPEVKKQAFIKEQPVTEKKFVAPPEPDFDDPRETYDGEDEKQDKGDGIK